MKKTYELSILNQKFVFRSDNDEKQVKKIADYVNKKMSEIVANNKAVSTVNVAILAALNIADDYQKLKQSQAQAVKSWVERLKEVVKAL